MDDTFRQIDPFSASFVEKLRGLAGVLWYGLALLFSC